jgi:hypothetical protein
MKKVLGLSLSALIASIFVSGCHIEDHHESIDPSDDTCGSYCSRLYECSSITGDQVGACLDECNAKLSLDSDTTSSGCACVLADECRAIADYDCPGAPVPPGASNGGGTNTGSAGAGNGGNTAGAGNATSSGGAPGTAGAASSAGGAPSTAGAASAAGAGSTPLGCQGGYDCADDQDCVDGACRQRCTASCQCPTDLSCIDHYCRSATPPPACSTDCECASGQHCISGACD